MYGYWLYWSYYRPIHCWEVKKKKEKKRKTQITINPNPQKHTAAVKPKRPFILKKILCWLGSDYLKAFVYLSMLKPVLSCSDEWSAYLQPIRYWLVVYQASALLLNVFCFFCLNQITQKRRKINPFISREHRLFSNICCWFWAPKHGESSESNPVKRDWKWGDSYREKCGTGTFIIKYKSHLSDDLNIGHKEFNSALLFLNKVFY